MYFLFSLVGISNHVSTYLDSLLLVVQRSRASLEDKSKTLRNKNHIRVSALEIYHKAIWIWRANSQVGVGSCFAVLVSRSYTAVLRTFVLTGRGTEPLGVIALLITLVPRDHHEANRLQSHIKRVVAYIQHTYRYPGHSPNCFNHPLILPVNCTRKSLKQWIARTTTFLSMYL